MFPESVKIEKDLISRAFKMIVSFLIDEGRVRFHILDLPIHLFSLFRQLHDAFFTFSHQVRSGQSSLGRRL